MNRSLESILGALALTLSLAVAHANESNPHADGLRIYKAMCVECHGPTGQGVEGKYEKALRGNRSLGSLVRRIERSMPEDNEDKCVGDDAKAVAEYIFHTFYSPSASDEVTGKDLTRLTVPQYRANIMDVVGHFDGSVHLEPGKERGIKGYYFGTRGYGTNEKDQSDKFEQMDDAIRFDFGEGTPKTPEGKKLRAQEFSIRWLGSLIAPETGEYQFVLRTRNGAQLWINEPGTREKQLIDGYVAGGNDVRDVKGSIYLVAGRAYPIKLEYFKYKEKNASIELLWKPPHGVLHTVPKRVLIPDRRKELMVVSSPLPADDRSAGYERGSSVSMQWMQGVTNGAVQAGNYISDRIDRFVKRNDDAAARSEAAKQFCRDLGSRAFRRTMSDDDFERYVAIHFAKDQSMSKAVKRSVIAIFTSPKFLYPRLSESEMDSFTVASRLGLMLWDSIPGRYVWPQAEKGWLTSEQNVRKVATGMLKNHRAKAKMRGFFHHWLELDRGTDISKSQELYSDFTPAIRMDLRTSLDQFLDDVVWSDASDYRRLLLEDHTFVNGRLAKFYGMSDHVTSVDFQRVKMIGGPRSGVLTHPYMLSMLAYHDNSSPIHRGVFLTRRIVGMTLKPPPEAIDFKEKDFAPNMTMREMVTEITAPKHCMACHTTINPLGFTLEHFDSVGRWRAKEQNKPIDSASDFTPDTGDTIRLNGARDLANFAASNPASHRAFIHQLFNHMVKQPVEVFEEGSLDRLHELFVSSEFNIQKLMVEIAVIAALDGVQVKK